MLGRRLEDVHAFNEWVTRNRLILWWGLLTPLFVLSLILSYPQLKIDPLPGEPTHPDLWFSVLNTPPILFLFRLVALLFGLVLLLIGFFLPTLRVGTQGVSWAHEIEEQLADMAGEFAGDEVERIVHDEKGRWESVLYWLRLDLVDQEPTVIVHGFLSMLRDCFPKDRMVLQIIGVERILAVTHPMLPFLVPVFPEEVEPGRRIGTEIHLANEEWLLVLETRELGGYSVLDQDFLWSMGEILGQKLQQFEVAELLPNLGGFSQVEVNPERGEGI